MIQHARYPYLLILGLTLVLSAPAYTTPQGYYTESLSLALPEPKAAVTQQSAAKTTEAPPTSMVQEQTTQEACRAVQRRMGLLQEAAQKQRSGTLPSLDRIYQIEQSEWRYYCH
ncbi:MAG: hypothetical protein V4490_05485 [Pseudomonadota bacterium]